VLSILRREEPAIPDPISPLVADVYHYVQIAASGSAEPGHAFTGNDESRTVLGPRQNRSADDGCVRQLDTDVAAQRRGPNGDPDYVAPDTAKKIQDERLVQIRVPEREAVTAPGSRSSRPSLVHDGPVNRKYLGPISKRERRPG
jgi:hypothetical protein